MKLLCVLAILVVLATQCHAKVGARLAAALQAAAGDSELVSQKAKAYTTDCYKLTKGKGSSLASKICSGDNLRAAVAVIGHNALKAAGKLTPLDDFPGDLKMCSNAPEAVTGAKQPGKAGADYFGSITTPSVFRKHAAAKCGGLNAANGAKPAAAYRYFTLGKYMYFRFCGGGDGNGYVYLWGTTDNSAVKCDGHDYPSMFGAAAELDKNARRNSPEKGSSTVTAFKALATQGTTTNPYLGMAAAAALIAEAARDYTVVALNYMLPDLVKDNELDFILGGRCPHNANTCQSGGTQNGLHPMAFGGALQSFTTNGNWPQAGGSANDDMKEFEAELVVKWLTKKLGLSNVKKQSNCDEADNTGDCRTFIESMVKDTASI